MPEFNMYQKSWSIARICNMYFKKRPEINFEADMQRGEVWNKTKSSLYIHSVFMDYLNYQAPFLLSKEVDENGKVYYDVLDGKQRGLTTLIRFINNEYALTGLQNQAPIDYDGEPYQLNGKRFKKLPEELQIKLKDATINVAIMENANHETKAEIFRRFNSGKAMSNFDLARSYREDMSDISELSKHELFTVVFSNSRQRKLPQQELVVKAYGVMFEENPSLRAKDITKLMQTLVISPEQKEQMIHAFDMTLGAYQYVLANCDNLKKEVVGVTNLLSYLPFAERFDTAESMGEWLIKFYSDKPQEYVAAATKATAASSNIKIRFDCIEKSINEFLNNDNDGQMKL